MITSSAPPYYVVSVDDDDDDDRGIRNGVGGMGSWTPPMATRQSANNNIIVSGEAILSAENSGKPLGGRGSVPNRA